MSANKNDNTKATIAHLVATDGSGDDEGLFKPQSAHDDAAIGSAEAKTIAIMQKMQQANMLVPGSELGTSFTDEYRKIKRPLISNAFGKSASLVDRGNLILITSSIPGEGKTYTAMNLALSIAQERDLSVLLIDCDVNMQGLSRLMGLSGRPGLVDVLVDENTSVGDVMLTTDIPGLKVLAAGKQVDYVNELLASKRMAETIDEIAARYDDRVIIIDGPPLLATPQTQVLAGLTGQVAFVIETGNTPQSLVNEALALLPEEQAVGAIMNKSEKLVGQNSYYYYGYYGSPAEEDS